MPTISVIMPMYNVERYVRTAIGSVLEQTFKDFELILIDDASTDGTLELAKSFDDRRLKIIELQKNVGGKSGPGAVRNIGLARACGKYIYFMDSDDAILPNGLELLFDAAEKNAVDAVISTSGFWAADPAFENLEGLKLIPIGNREAGFVERDLKRRIMRGYCNKGLPVAGYHYFYRRKFLVDNGIKYGDMIFHEDGAFMIEVHCSTNNMFKMSEPYYVFRKQEGSLTRPKAATFEHFAKHVRSFLAVEESFERSLSKGLKREYGEVDQYFIDVVCLSIKKRASLSALGHFYERDPYKCWEVVRAEVEARYGSGRKASVMRKLLTGYFMSELACQATESDAAEYKKLLKAVKTTINQVIPF